MSVYIVNCYRQYYKLFKEKGWDIYDPVREGLSTDIELVCFTGGEDVSPSLYMKHPHRLTHASPNRDLQEIGIYLWAKRNGIPCVGICRGGQFLNVMNGGEMLQHIVGGHHTHNHLIVPVSGDAPTIMATSTHHQMMIPHEDGGVLAVDARNNKDVEVVLYKDTADLCFQPHPEFGEQPLKDYFFGLIERYLL